MVNSERDVTLVPRAVDPPGDARPDWQLVADVACAMGFAADFTYASAEDVFAEIVRFANPSDRLRPRRRDVRPAARGPGAVAGGARRAGAQPDPLPRRQRRDALRRRRAGGPCSTPDRTPTRPSCPTTTTRSRSTPAACRTSGTRMTKTGKVARLNRLDDGPFVEVHPADAAPLGITSGDVVEVASRRGRAVLPAVVSDRVQPGNLFAPIHWNDRHGEYASVNAVTNDAVDPVSFQPELKVCAVALTKVAVPRRAAGQHAAARSPRSSTSARRR